MNYRGDVVKNSDSEEILPAYRDHQGLEKRKLSLGIILRKISSGSLQGVRRKTSLQERRSNNAFSKLISIPSFVNNTLGKSSQVDSSSWEFLNKSIEFDYWEENGRKATYHHRTELIENKHPSKDSVYESEYDSSSTLSSSSSTIQPALFTAAYTV